MVLLLAMVYSAALLSVMSSTEDRSVTSTRGSTVTSFLHILNHFNQSCHLLKIAALPVLESTVTSCHMLKRYYQLCYLLKIAVLPVLEKVLLPAIQYTEAFISYVIF